MQRLVRGAAVIPFLCLMMLFPVGVLCGALTQLNTAVCSGTAGVQGCVMWRFCTADAAAAHIWASLVLQAVD